MTPWQNHAYAAILVLSNVLMSPRHCQLLEKPMRFLPEGVSGRQRLRMSYSPELRFGPLLTGEQDGPARGRTLMPPPGLGKTGYGQRASFKAPRYAGADYFCAPFLIRYSDAASRKVFGRGTPLLFGDTLKCSEPNGVSTGPLFHFNEYVELLTALGIFQRARCICWEAIRRCAVLDEVERDSSSTVAWLLQV